MEIEVLHYNFIQFSTKTYWHLLLVNYGWLEGCHIKKSYIYFKLGA